MYRNETVQRATIAALHVYRFIKVILCASEHIYDIASEDPLHVLTDANVLVLIDTDQSIFVNGRFSLPSAIHQPII